MASNIRRPITRRALVNRDENAENTRVNRQIKDGIAGPSTTLPVAKSTAAIGLANRKRAALGDVSNYVLNRDEQTNKVGKPIERDLKGKGPAKLITTTRIGLDRARPSSDKITELTEDNAESGSVPAAKKPHARTTTQRVKRDSSESSIKVEDSSRESTDKESGPVSKKSRVDDVARDQGWQDLDLGDGDDPLMVSEYVTEIFEYMQQLEIKTMPKANYMDNQKELAWKMRGILVDWLIEVHAKFRLLPETLFLAVNIIDRFLSARVVSLVKLQLVGITAMFIASKYEEVMSPSIQNFLYMADGGYGDDEILKAERYILQTLNFDLSYPNPMNFLRRISKADDYDISTRTVAKYLVEISLVDHRFLSHPPSIICAAAIWMARKALRRGPWNPNLVHYSNYDESEFKEVSVLMTDYLSNDIRHESFYKKYASKKFLKASVFMREWVAKGIESGDLNKLTEL